MKKIINGLVYNTETAVKIGNGSSLCGQSDFNYWDATLYKTPKGRFFLAGEGGAMSMFSRKCDGNLYCGGKGIIPMSKERAFEWAQDNLSNETIEEHFSDMIEIA